jgi:hypothetical protein
VASEATTIVKQETEKHISELIAERAERGWDLHLRRRQLIIKTDADTYTVPAESGHKTYTVHYGDQVEDCTCADFGVHRGEVACKHLTAVAFLYARRRRVHSRCEVYGAGSSEKALVGIRNDHRRHGPRYCLPHHFTNLRAGETVENFATNAWVPVLRTAIQEGR